LTNESKSHTQTQPSRGTASLWVSVAILTLLIKPANGQTITAPPAPAPQTPTVSTQVEEVSLDLVVHDRRHKPVVDLKPGDIAVSDNDSPVTLNGLHLVTGESNTGHLITLVFDRLGGTSAKNAQNIANTILKLVPKNGFSFAVLDLGGRLRLIQGFSTDRKAILKAVELVTNEKNPAPKTISDAAEKNLVAIAQTGADSAGAPASAKNRVFAKTLLSALVESQRIVQDQHTRPSLAGLLALARSQQRVTEHKTIIYFTQNTQMDSAAKETLNTIAGVASRAGVTIDTIDMNALDVGGKYQLDMAMAMGGAPYSPARITVAPGITIAPPMQQIGAAGPTSTIGMATDFTRQSSQNSSVTKSPMAELSANTGGIYIDAQDRVKKPLAQMLQDMTTYYQATYLPPIKEYNGAFRAISVKPLRTGLNVQSRSGYFAVPTAAGSDIRPFEMPLLKLLNEPKLPEDLKFRSAILRMGVLPDGNTNTLVIETPISELELRKDFNTHLFSAHVSIVAQIKDKNGSVIEHFGEDITRRGALEAAEKGDIEPLTLQRHFISAPGEYVLEAAVLDHYSGLTGAQRINFTVSETSGSLSISDMVLVRRTAATHADTDSFEPLQYENAIVMPNLSGQVSRSQKDVSLFFILHTDPHASESGALDMEVLRNGIALSHSPLPIHQSSPGASVPYMASFPAGFLVPGIYRIKAKFTQVGKTAEQEFSFNVDDEQHRSAVTDARQRGDDAAFGTDLESASVDARSFSPGSLLFRVPDHPVQALSQDEAHTFIAAAQERAIGYTESLPNFMCVEVTNRSVDPSGTGNWKHQDTLTELLRYHDKSETRVTLQVDGKVSNSSRDAMKGTFSSGEFGDVLGAVFKTSSKADFLWKQTDMLGNGPVQVFDYRVLLPNSEFKVSGVNDLLVTVGFHGQVFIDSATRGVRRVTLIADDLAADFSTHATSMAVNYDYVVINAHDYLMPVSAELTLQQRHGKVTRNTIEFRNYRRFGSDAQLIESTDKSQP